ncbi:MAG: MFS transporter [Gammaproteobacteria bacterium]|nr:MAG: MFS transporter [Gammaproteobacteria bacterium]
MERAVYTRPAWGWALYDWANSAFATTVMAGFFPVFFKQFWAGRLSATDSTFWLGATNSLAAMLVVLAAPLIGLWADRAGMKKRLVATFAVLGILMSGGLFLVAEGMWPLALLLYLGAVLGFSGGNVAYDALLPVVAAHEDLERVSALGFSLGYLGGGLLFALNVVMVLQPAWFALTDSAEAVRWSFLMVALWWTLFTIPLLLWVPDDGAGEANGLSTWQELRRTWRELRALPMAFLFLISYWLYIDGVDTIVRMAVDYGLAIGLDSSDLLSALLITQFVGFPAALLFGWLGARFGAKHGIWFAILVYMLVVLWAWRMQSAAEFYALAVAIGMVQGGIQALSRALFARLVPREQAGRFFGLYNMMGKFAAVVGPVLVGVVAMASGSSRVGILSVLALFLVAAVLLARVDVARGEREARALA